MVRFSRVGLPSLEMSLSRCKSALKQAYKSLSRSRHSSTDDDVSVNSSFLPQVTRKVEALERAAGSIEIESPSLEHRPILGQEETSTSDVVDPPLAVSTTVSPHGRDSVSFNSQSASISDGVPSPSITSETEEQGPVGASSTRDTCSVASVKTTSEEVAQHLISKEEIMTVYFSSLIERLAKAAIEENLTEEKCDFTTSLEESKARERGEDRFTKLCDLPLKLILTPLRVRGPIVSKFASLLEMQFGPLHAALQVGDVILEWNDTNLVVPHNVEHDDQLMRTDVCHLTDWVRFTSGEVPRVREAIRTLDYQKQIELIYHVTAEKRRLLDNLVEVIVTYNRQYYYDVIRRNCQHFVTDALKALGVNEPVEFTGGLREYFHALKRGRSPAVLAKFTDHSHLDRYIIDKEQNRGIDKLTKDDLEYLLAQYFRYHLERKSKLQLNSREMDFTEWSCEIKDCHMEMLEQRINFESLRIHSFKTYDRPR